MGRKNLCDNAPRQAACLPRRFEKFLHGEFMGTTKEWIEVAFAGIFWGGWMLVWSALRNRQKSRPAVSSMDVIVWTLAGLCYGIMTTFHWQRASHPPIVFLLVASLVGALVAARFLRPKSVDA